MISTSSSIDKANIAKSKVFEESIQNNLAANMVSAWDADHVTKGATWVLHDKWGNNNGTFYDDISTVCSSTGTITCPQIVNDKNMGNVLSFDGVNDYIDLGNRSDLNLTSSATISLWMYIPSSWTGGTRYPNIISKGANQGWDTNGWSLYAFRWSDDKRIGIGMRNGATVNVADFQNAISDSWMHIAGFWNGSKIKVYQNGSERRSVDQTINPPATSTSVLIGKSASNFLSGMLSNVKIYDEALSATQIKQNYIAGLDSLLSKNLISKQEYDKGVGSLAND